jgi:hypothetical protein
MSDAIHVVTIFNFPPEARYQALMTMFLDRIIRHGAERITILHEQHRPAVADGFSRLASIDLRQGQRVDVGHPHHNLNFKLPNLAAIDEPFLFLDADMAVLADLRPLWNLRHGQPWIGVNHGWVKQDPRTHRSPFLNSGLQLVGDPGFYDLGRILAVQEAAAPLRLGHSIPKDEMFACPGTDQAVLFRYFREIGYDYTHPQVGQEWNRCAAEVKLTHDGVDWHGSAYGEDVKIVHYWNPFKPWAIDCPLYGSYMA